MLFISHKYFLLFLGYVLCQATTFSQRIDINVSNLNVEKALVSHLAGEKIAQIDSITSSDKQRFVFTLKAGQNHPGIYRLSLDKTRWIDFVNDGEDVKIVTDANAMLDSIKILTSESNELYYSFLKLHKQCKTKTELLQLVLARYPKEDPYYRTTQTTLNQLQEEYSDFVRNALQEKPNSFVARYVRSAQLPIVDSNLPIDRQLPFLKSHSLDNVDFNDDGLIYSDAFTTKTIEYLTYYRNPQLPKELLEKEFMVAVDTILNKARINQIVYQHITEYLIDGFKKFGFEKCIDYILDNYVIKDDLCLADRLGNTVQRMIDQKKNLWVGSIVPNLTLPDTSGHTISLMSIKAEESLIVFYSTACPHCQTMIPKLAELYKRKSGKNFAVLAISLDSNRADWTNFIRNHNLGWLNVIDTRGWNGQAASDYFIYATPTMILIDKNKKIIGKPLTVEELLTISP